MKTKDNQLLALFVDESRLEEGLSLLEDCINEIEQEASSKPVTRNRMS